MDPHGDKYAYARKSGAIPQQRCAVSTKAISVSGSSRGMGALGAAPESKIGMGKTANLEGNESARYEKLEKRSLTSLKGGGTEKELRAGHNFSFGDVAKKSSGAGLMGGLFGGGDSGPSAAQRQQAKRQRTVRQVAKTGTAVDAAKNPVLAAKVARREAVQTAKRDVGEKSYVRGTRQQGRQAIQAARQERKGFSKEQKKEARQSYRATAKSARKALR